MKKYCIWNNKGGVGKTFLTYSLSTEYAIANPDKNVIVVDMCPQANVSGMLLGGDGDGENVLGDYISKEISIASYIIKRQESPSNLLGTETTFFVKINNKNKNMPENLYLLPGDTDLDLCSNIIDYLAMSPKLTAWKDTMYILMSC
ncbi:MAG: AAA family ATPase [Rickettsiales bacterium]|jgi:cellulose biosynthesis protein BcsQ|nr:AAA family ATPase [Rickettsiales bacterium]